MEHRSRRLFAPIDFRMRFPALDGLRALAIVAVFLDHYGGGSHGGLVLNLLNRVRLYGWMGVDLFFVLSGFLITGILYDTLGDSKYFRRFFARRSLRIFPIFYAVFALLLLLTPLTLYQWRAGHLLFLLYLGNLIGNYDFSYYGIVAHRFPDAKAEISHFWSLCVEEQFYLLWPVVVFALRRRRLIVVAILLSIVAAFLRLALYLHGGAHAVDQWGARMLPTRMDSLLIGGTLALLLRGRFADAVQRSCKWLLLFGGAATLVIVSLDGPRRDLLFSFILYSVLAIACAGLVGCTLRPESVCYRLFNLTPLRILGKYSYGFYVYHLLFQRLWIDLLIILGVRFHSLALAGTIALTLNFAVTFAVSKLSYDCFESRFLRYKRHFEYDLEVTSHRHAFVTK